MATRPASKGRRTSRTSVRRAAKKRTTTRRAAKGVHVGRPNKEIAHGYATGFLKREPKDAADAKRVLDEIWADLQARNNGYPDHKAHMELSLMEVTAGHKSKVRAPGKELFLFVSFPNQLPPGNDIAHQRIHDLADTINSNSNCAQGLGNHWCCYSDKG